MSLIVLHRIVSVVSSSKEAFYAKTISQSSGNKSIGSPYLEIVLDQVENEVPVCSRNVLQDRYEMEKHVGDLALDVFINVRIRSNPSLARLHKVHRTRLWQEHYVRVWIRCRGRETA